MNNIVVEKGRWLEARRALLEQEKAHMKANDALKKNLRALPWLKIEKNYVFTTNDGEKDLVELFQGRSQLFIKHFMMAPGQQWQCVGCSLECDHMNGLLPHLENHDISYVVVARAPMDEIEKYVSAWAGTSVGCPLSGRSSTTTWTFPSDRSSSNLEPPNTIFAPIRARGRSSPETASFIAMTRETST